MPEIFRGRTIRPSSRLEKSKNYKIDTKNIGNSDILVVNIDHESKSFQKTYKFRGTDVANKNSISFRVDDYGMSIEISWSGAQPINTTGNLFTSEIKNQLLKISIEKDKKWPNLKKSFEPISNSETSILILGTMPGDKSLELNEYYGHSRNRFWKIISNITQKPLPVSYLDKQTLLFKTKIGIWDVAHTAYRKGSLDIAIEEEEPNDLESFILRHKNLKTICFNGAKSERIFKKYFKKKQRITYISLPSTSPSNASINFENICEQWKKILSV